MKLLSEIVDESDSDLDNLAPIITGPSGISGEASNAIAVVEKLSDIYTFSADEKVSWSIAGGSDSDSFSINSETGKLIFSAETSYDNPSDTNEDNSYELIIKATDLVGFSSVQNITVVVKPSSTDKNKFGDSTYQFVKANSWEEAQKEAQNLGGYLVSINNQEENQFLVDNFSDFPNFDSLIILMNLLHGLVIQIFAKKGIGNGPLAKFLNMQTGILENQMKVACKILKILKIMLKYT